MVSTQSGSLIALVVVALAAVASSCSAGPTTDLEGGTESTSTPASPPRAVSPAPAPSVPDASPAADAPDPGTGTRTEPEGGASPSRAPADVTSGAGAGGATSDVVEVVPVLSWAGVDDGKVVVDAYVPIVELGGTCSLTLEREATRVEVSAAAEPDAEVTWCAPLEIAVSDLAAGAWEATVGYSGSSPAGSSVTTTVTVP